MIMIIFHSAWPLVGVGLLRSDRLGSGLPVMISRLGRPAYFKDSFSLGGRGGEVISKDTNCDGLALRILAGKVGEWRNVALEC